MSFRKVADKIYVEINQSGMHKKSIMKLLKEYNFSIGEFKVYFRADYTSLNDK